MIQSPSAAVGGIGRDPWLHLFFKNHMKNAIKLRLRSI
jgi:hypothetical protein